MKKFARIALTVLVVVWNIARTPTIKSSDLTQHELSQEQNDTAHHDSLAQISAGLRRRQLDFLLILGATALLTFMLLTVASQLAVGGDLELIPDQLWKLLHTELFTPEIDPFSCIGAIAAVILAIIFFNRSIPLPEAGRVLTQSETQRQVTVLRNKQAMVTVAFIMSCGCWLIVFDALRALITARSPLLALLQFLMSAALLALACNFVTTVREEVEVDTVLGGYRASQIRQKLQPILTMGPGANPWPFILACIPALLFGAVGFYVQLSIDRRPVWQSLQIALLLTVVPIAAVLIFAHQIALIRATRAIKQSSFTLMGTALLALYSPVSGLVWILVYDRRLSTLLSFATLMIFCALPFLIGGRRMVRRLLHRSARRLMRNPTDKIEV